MIQILIVDDEKPICDLIQMSLTRAGYHCTCVYDGLAAADILERNVFDLILLDVMLPNADGFELMEYIRPLGIPVIFLTARGSVDDRVRGLRMGAEDYIVKPFEVVELLARVDVVLRRYNKTDAVIEIGGLRIDTRAMQVWRGTEEISLTHKEYDLLLFFAQPRHRALPRDDLRARLGRRIQLRQQDRGSAHPAAAQKGRLGKPAVGREQGRLPAGGMSG